MEVFFKNPEDDFFRKTGLTQWDYGQELEIWGLPGITHAELHFCLENELEAKIVPAKIGAEKLSAPIPDEFLRRGDNIYAYLYIATPEKGETIKTIFLPVKRRAQPKDYCSLPDRNLLRQLIESLEKKADNIRLLDGDLQLLSGKKEIGNRIRLPTTGSGREIELRNNGTAIQWRYTDSNQWTDLASVESLKGKDGVAPALEIREGHLFAIYEE